MPVKPWARHLAVVLLITALFRLIAWVSLPLIITNDGAFYLAWASELAHGSWPDLTSTRTPGYIVFLACVFTMLGESAAAVSAAQHGLGIACAFCGWWIGRRIAGPRVGLAAGSRRAPTCDLPGPAFRTGVDQSQPRLKLSTHAKKSEGVQAESPF